MATWLRRPTSSNFCIFWGFFGIFWDLGKKEDEKKKEGERRREKKEEKKEEKKREGEEIGV